MVTDLAEVRRLGTAKAKENVDFRRFLAAHHLGEEPFRILAAEVQRHIDCTACANCCRDSVVPVGDSEIETIAQHLALSAETVARGYTSPDPDEPAQRILRADRGGCVFLRGNLCGIYEARPKACRDFPHIAPGSHSLGSRHSSHDRWVARCPILYNATEDYKRLTGYHPHRPAA